jgi:hypothetical protein
MAKPTPLEETADALQTYIYAEGVTPYAWAISRGISPGTVYDVLRERSVSDKRLNTIRPALGLAPITRQKVVIDPAREKVVRRQGPARYVSRQVRLTEDEALLLDDYISFQGWRSFSAWFRNEQLYQLLGEYCEGEDD